MAMPVKTYWFRPGRLEKAGRRNPGILAVGDKFEFTAHESSKDPISWSYRCKYRLTPKVRCPARARVIMFEDKWILQSADNNHTCEPNKAKVTAELLRCRMKSIVRANPALPCGQAVRTVRIQAATEFGNDDDFYKHLVAELGTDAALEKQLLRVRHEVIGPTPRSRNAFDAQNFIERIYGIEDDLIVLDSNMLGDKWREEISKVNNKSAFDWTKLNDNIRNIEEEFHEDDNSDQSMETEAEDEPTDVLERDLPKRVLIFTSKKLLKQLSLNKKSSVDGTFKSSCKLWTQQFIWMSKSKGFWIPCAFGWLPDKSEISYKVFFLLIQKKMAELDLDLKVKAVLCDFEINILKSIDQMLETDIFGCFFHHKKCFQRKVDKKGFKTRYENDDYFHEFVNQACGLAHLPIADIEDGLNYIEKRFVFDDERAIEFKADFIRYIRDFWIHGCLPPRIWNVFGRSEDLTNNNQEGFNAKFNRELKETHPSPGILLSNIRGQIKLAEEKIIKQKAGVKKPAQRKTYKDLAKSRLNLKKNYLEARENNDSDAISDFLSSMGHNVASSLMQGRTDNYEETRRNSYVRDTDDLDTSSWIAKAHDESTLEELENPDTYPQRKVGVKEPKAWKKKKCSSCKVGFNSRSNPIKCNGCDSYTHRKQACIREGSQNAQFYCTICIPTTLVGNASEEPSIPQSSALKVDNGFKCEVCGLIAKTKYSIKRHVDRKHGNSESNPHEEPLTELEIVANETSDSLCITFRKTKDQKKEVCSVNDLLKLIDLEQYIQVLEAEQIDLDMLLSLKQEQFMEMVRDVGIIPWGHRHKLREALDKLKETRNDDPVETSYQTESWNVESCDSTDIVNTSLSNDACDLCAKATQHKCSKCGIPVCNLKCSEQDPSSDNEQHRIHKKGDARCVQLFETNMMDFTCPKCTNTFTDVEALHAHMDREHADEQSFPTMSLASDGTISDIWETCKTCGKVFENELDLKNHMERVHVYGELFQLYPCEECGFRASDLTELRIHLAEGHPAEESICEDEISLVDLGITKLPLVGKRRKQNFHELQIDTHGVIEVEDDLEKDNDFIASREDEILMMSDDDSDTVITAEENIKEKEVNKKRKAKSNAIEAPSKRKKIVGKPGPTLKCEICNIDFSRKDNLSRHMRNKH